MAKELDLQRDICQSVREQGGYARKLTAQGMMATVGMPDLLLVVPGFVPCLSEVKRLGKVPPKFKRKLGFTDKQRYEMAKLNEAAGTTIAFGLVGFEQNNKHWLVAVSHELDTLSHDGYFDGRAWAVREVGKKYDIAGMFNHMKIRRLTNG